MMPAFSPAIERQRVAEEIHVVACRSGVIDAGRRRVDDVGGVEPAAEADLEQQHVGRVLGEQMRRPPRS